jgi:hypothetical protein
MLTPDIINGSFEIGMTLTISRSVYRLYKEKRVKGWSSWAVLWPTAWGFWNLYYYPHLNQPFSFIGGLFVVTVNSTWLALAFKYRKAANIV